VPCPDQLHVEVLNDEIVVILPATSYGVVYYKPANSTQLLVRNEFPSGAPITQAEFLARALQAARAEARELGWIVWRNQIRAARGRKAGLPHVGRLITG
jgi:hypothetical protein